MNAPMSRREFLKASGALVVGSSSFPMSEALAQTAGTAARDNNAQKAQGAYNALGKACKGCHDSHREAMPDKSFKIKP